MPCGWAKRRVEKEAKIRSDKDACGGTVGEEQHAAARLVDVEADALRAHTCDDADIWIFAK